MLAKKLASVRTLGPHPGDKEPVSVRKGRFGPYVQHGKTVANLPRGVAMEDISLDEAVRLLAEKGKQLKPKGGARRKGAAAKPAPAAKREPKAAAKPAPAPAKRAAPKKAAAKKKPAPKKRKPAAKVPARRKAAAE